MTIIIKCPRLYTHCFSEEDNAAVKTGGSNPKIIYQTLNP